MRRFVLTIEPWSHGNGWTVLRIRLDGVGPEGTLSWEHPVRPNEFQSMFRVIMQYATESIERVALNANPIPGESVDDEDLPF